MGFELWGATGLADFFIVSLGALWVFGMLVNVRLITSRPYRAKHRH